jgi:hypothetical protein
MNIFYDDSLYNFAETMRVFAQTLRLTMPGPVEISVRVVLESHGVIFKLKGEPDEIYAKAVKVQKVLQTPAHEPIAF